MVAWDPDHVVGDVSLRAGVEALGRPRGWSRQLRTGQLSRLRRTHARLARRVGVSGVRSRELPACWWKATAGVQTGL